MDRSPLDIQNRLVLLQAALDKSSAEIERETGIKRNAWSQFRNYRKYKRRITIDDALALKDAYGVTLEWIFDNQLWTLPDDLADKIRAAVRRAA